MQFQTVQRKCSLCDTFHLVSDKSTWVSWPPDSHTGELTFCKKHSVGQVVEYANLFYIQKNRCSVPNCSNPGVLRRQNGEEIFIFCVQCSKIPHKRDSSETKRKMKGIRK